MKNPDFDWVENGLETRLYIQHFVTEIPLSFEPFLYQTADYLNAQNCDRRFSFYLFRKGEALSAACIHFTNIDTSFVSPLRAPFGGVQCDEKCKANELSFFLRCVEDWFSSQTNATKCIIRTAATCYKSADKHFLLFNSYETAGYKITRKFINHHIPVSRSPFVNTIIPAERRRLAKCRKSGFQAELYAKPDFEIVYNFIHNSRSEKGYLMSMTPKQVDVLINKFPHQCRIFVVRDESKIIAMSVTVLVSKGILYNFLPADLSDYKSFSPMVYLLETVYNYCQKEEIRILDLGISTDHHGIEKPGLLKFKKNLGGIESFKITYEKKIEVLLGN
ncbi:GNAT family N-acetyltransferase [Dyadobacter subterraneus]|uniref:GNAT family N-acetyltransferase n=1 Tax=Dyadobacter subterraneus TaxID=2773304 RepID=A0ABR9WH69_9BACT|nr:GNAT family N-acetyltransferase [Dyadobacter subterraneus]MBE9464785.1 GNAT family N-acetyltransferase [Dyadobacter subterraneus]